MRLTDDCSSGQCPASTTPIVAHCPLVTDLFVLILILLLLFVSISNLCPIEPPCLQVSYLMSMQIAQNNEHSATSYTSQDELLAVPNLRFSDPLLECCGSAKLYLLFPFWMMINRCQYIIIR